MKNYTILKKSSFLVAIDRDNSISSSEIRQLNQQGFKVVATNIIAVDSKNALKLYGTLLKNYTILKKSRFLVAIDTDNSLSLSEIRQLNQQGFKVVATNISAVDSENALKLYGAFYEKPEVEKSPLDKANETIRAANCRISELKTTISRLNNDLLMLEETNRTLRNQLRDSNTKFSAGVLDRLELLGVSEPVCQKTLSSNYKRLSLIYHPDKGGSPNMMKRINEAYDFLST
ncbi:J domain-containing protein [Vibrio anguillarum]|uniref:J domain-containing protein n=1 Tax=Vibrio anguillarum TaxID=55601 RepID=A0AAW4BG65_VIBAN|nr:J domain-containing protein [Vibrio anguillarum]